MWVLRPQNGQTTCGFRTKSFPTITFSQQIIGGKLLLGFNWDNHFKLCIKKTTNEKLTEENCA